MFRQDQSDCWNRFGHLWGIVVVLLVCLPACSRWSAQPSRTENWQLRPPKMSPDSVVLEVAFVRTTPDLRDELVELWSEVDEQIMPTEMRRQLHDNGLRCGVTRVQLPVGLQKLLDKRQEELDLTNPDFAQVEQQVSPHHMPHRIHSRSGARSSVTAGPIEERVHVLVNEEGGTRGETFEKAQCMFSVRSFPKGDGRVRLELTPEIEHGEARNRRVATEGVWRLDFGRDRKAFDSLRMETTLEPGQTLIVSSGAEPIGIGRCFFNRDEETTLFLVRVAQTQRDDLFREETPYSPIATPAD